METKREKFLRLANSRTNKVIDTIDLISNLANTSNYEYSKKDVEKIFKAMETALRLSKMKFDQTTMKKNKFKI